MYNKIDSNIENKVMSFFAKGDYKIQESWQEDNKLKSRQKSRQKNLLFMNLGKNIAQPSTDILDDSITKKILKQFQSEVGPKSTGKTDKNKKVSEDNKKLPPKQKNLNNDSDLLTSMTIRLKQIQMTCKNQRQEIKEKNALIQKMKMENSFLKGMKEDSGTAYQQLQSLKKQNQNLQTKVQQMQAYLKQYGLKWVGHQIEGKLKHQQLKKDISKKYNYRLPSQIDINTIRRRIQDLNASLHAQGQGTQIYIDNGIHKLRPAQPLLIGFYADGLAIKGLKFYPYSSKDSIKILSDILDGYFPYVLKHKYPNGIFLKVLDMVEKKYSNEVTEESINNLKSAQEKQLLPQSKQQFLNKLPKQVIKNGKVIQIRSEIQKRFHSNQQKNDNNNHQIHCQEIDGLLVFKTQEHSLIRNNQLSQEQTCSLKIRINSKQKIKQIYCWLDKVVENKYRLMGNYPRRTYQESLEQNLEELGFYPNVNLHIQQICI